MIQLALLSSSLPLHPQNRPQVGRRRKRKDKTGEKDGGANDLKLPMFAIFKVTSAQFHKEKHGQNEV